MQIFSLKVEALLKQQKHDEADALLLSAQKIEDTLRKFTSLPADITTLLTQVQVDMALDRYRTILFSYFWGRPLKIGQRCLWH